MRQVGLLVGAFGLAATLALTGCKSTGAADDAACCGTNGACCKSDHDHADHDHDDHGHEHAACCGACGGEKKNLAAIPAGIEAAHGKPAYDAMGAAGKLVMAEFDVDFGGGDLLAGTMWFDTQVGQARMELDNGAVVVFDGEACWVSQDAPDIPYGYRFHALTWPYFLAAPFKLSDPGVSHALIEEAPLTASRTSEATKMTFDDGVGDAPDDWYVVFPVPHDGSLAALAYIVTYDMAVAYAEAKPSIVFYTQPETVDGATFATELIFHFWDQETGVQGEEPKGVMTVSNIAFVDPPAEAFAAFDGSVESTLPGEESDVATADAEAEAEVVAEPAVSEDTEAAVETEATLAEEAMDTIEEAAAQVEEMVEDGAEAVGDALEDAAEAADEAIETTVEVVTPGE
ncbi:MAG: hypothetical protein AAGH92_12610 [Planctomycetota bacterium]